MDVLFLRVLDQPRVLQQRVPLDLVGYGNLAGRLDDRLEVLNGEVAHANSANLLLRQLKDSLPGIYDRNVVVDGHVTVGLVLALDEREVVVAVTDFLEGHRPVDEELIEVGKVELLESFVERGLDGLGAMVCVPELGSLVLSR